MSQTPVTKARLQYDEHNTKLYQNYSKKSPMSMPPPGTLLASPHLKAPKNSVVNLAVLGWVRFCFFLTFVTRKIKILKYVTSHTF